MIEKVFIAAVVVGLLLIVIRGLWRATSVQEGTGCPVCDRQLGHDHDHEHHTASNPDAKDPS